VAIWQRDKRVLGIFSLRMRKNGYLGAAFSQKSDLAIRFSDTDFLSQRNNNSSAGVHFRYVLAISLLRMRRSSDRPKTALTVEFSDQDFL